MTEITKLYKLAGVEAINIVEYGSTYIPNKIEIDGKPYPPFTAEKQIELIKILTKKNAIGTSLPLSDLYMFYFECRHYPRAYMTFEEAIAECINYLWQDLTTEEQEQIREVLK